MKLALKAILIVTIICSVALAGEKTRSAAKTVVCREYRTGFVDGDCAYHAVHFASNGKVYFTICTHTAQKSARIFCFDRATGKVTQLWSVDDTAPGGGAISHGKLHCPLAEYKGELYAATLNAWYYKDHTNPATGKVQAPYKGACVYAVNMATGKGRRVARVGHGFKTTLYKGRQAVPMDGEGVVTSIFDPARASMYMLRWPSGTFVRLNLKTGDCIPYESFQQYGESTPIWSVDDDGERHINSRYEIVLRTLGMDGEGSIYGSNKAGRIWKYIPAKDKFVKMKARMANASGIKISQRVSHLNYWRTIVWDPKDRVFYGIHWATSWLFRYDPKADRIEPVTGWRPEGYADKPVMIDHSQLGFSIGTNRTLYGLVHCPPRKRGVKRSVHLLTYNIDEKKLTDHGPVATAAGRAVMFAETCAVDKNGDVYSVAWVESAPEERAEIVRGRKYGLPDARKYAYLMSLIRIPARNINF